MGDADLVRGPAHEPAHTSTLGADRDPQVSTQGSQHRELTRRDLDVISVDLLADLPERFAERVERVALDLRTETPEDIGRDGGGHSSVPDPRARAERVAQIESGSEAICSAHATSMMRLPDGLRPTRVLRDR
jgi:hypothetical protein